MLKRSTLGSRQSLRPGRCDGEYRRARAPLSLKFTWGCSPADRATQSAFDLSHAENELEQTSRRSQARCPIQLPIQLAPKSTAC
jgi:hypothetical protein